MGLAIWLNCSRMRSLEEIPFAGKRILDTNNNLVEEVELRDLKDVLEKVMDIFFGDILTADEMTVMKMSLGFTPEGIAYAPEEIAESLGKGYRVEHVKMLTQTALGKFRTYLPGALKHYQSLVRTGHQLNINLLH